MEIIKIDRQYTTQEDIGRILEKFYKIGSESESEIRISFQQKVIEIDILLIAYLIAIKEINPKLSLIIELNHNEFKDDDNSVEFKLLQHLVHAFLMTGKIVFRVKYGLGDNKETDNIKNIGDYFTFNANLYVWSKSFMPVLVVNNLASNINNELFNLLFEKGLNYQLNEGNKLHVLPKGVEYNIKQNILYASCKDTIRKIDTSIKIERGRRKYIKQIIPSEISKYILDLGRLAFYMALYEAKILSIYLDPYYRNDVERRRTDLHVGRLQYSKKSKTYKQYDFYKNIKYIFDDLSNKPLIYHFVYSTLLSSDLLPDELSPGNQGEFEKDLQSLWEFTKDLVHGIKELAKNIRDHAEPPLGVITGRVYKEDIWEELKKSKPENKKVFDRYLSGIKKEKKEHVPSFFDFNVIDLGERGVIETLLNSNEIFLKQSDVKMSDNTKIFIKEDIQYLREGKIKLNNFLSHEEENVLNQQTKRATSHLGLLIFSKLIYENKGLVRASSWQTNKNDISRDEATVSKFFKSKTSNSLPYGTNYNIVLPILSAFKPILTHRLSVPLESTEIEVRGVEEMLYYQPIHLTKHIKKIFDINIQENVKPLFCIVLNDEDKDIMILDRNRENEIWLTIINIIENNAYIIESEQNGVINLDMNKIEIEGGQLFRLLGKWEIDFPKNPLIISNIKTDIFDELIRINEDYLVISGKHLDYWNENSVILMYSYCNIRDGYFYFADALWGKTKADFINVNKLIRKTNFNATMSLGYDQKGLEADHEEILESVNRLSIIAQLGLFHDKITLMPFDLLLCGKNKLTIFEHNASVLLQNELKLFNADE